MLMPWLFTSAGYKQPWYWLCKRKGSFFIEDNPLENAICQYAGHFFPMGDKLSMFSGANSSKLVKCHSEPVMTKHFDTHEIFSSPSNLSLMIFCGLASDPINVATSIDVSAGGNGLAFREPFLFWISLRLPKGRNSCKEQSISVIEMCCNCICKGIVAQFLCTNTYKCLNAGLLFFLTKFNHICPQALVEDYSS